MSKYSLIGGPFDGTDIELPHGINRIELETDNGMPGIENPKGSVFTIVENYIAVYEEDDLNEDMTINNRTEQHIKECGTWPLYFNLNKSGTFHL